MNALNTVIALLKQSRNEMQLKDIVQRTGDEIIWPKVPTRLMNRVMEYDTKVIRVDRGVYKYQSPTKSTPVAAVVAPAVIAPPAEPAVEPTPPPPEQKKAPTLENRLKTGQVVTGVVSRVMTYGAFIDIPEYQETGLLHVSNMKRGVHFFRTEDIERHFQTGDVIQVKFISYREGRASFSTLGLPLPDHRKEEEEETKLAEKLKPIVAKIKTVAPEPETKPEPTPPEPEPKPETPAPLPPEYQFRFSPASSSLSRDELEDLYEIIRKKVGVISLTAKDALKDAVKRNGIVKVTMALMATDDFEADVSLAFVRYVESKANGGL